MQAKLYSRRALAVSAILIFATGVGLIAARHFLFSPIPLAVREALSRMGTIVPGTREGEVFSVLGLQKPLKVLDSEIEGRTGATWTQYEIGFGREFVLKCESMNYPVEVRDFEDGILLTVKIAHYGKQE